MKRQKRLTKKERKQAQGTHAKASATRQGHAHEHTHIHCIACGKHLDVGQFGEPDGADYIRCEHGSHFPHCVACHDAAKVLVEEHDRTEQPVKTAAAWH